MKMKNSLNLKGGFLFIFIWIASFVMSAQNITVRGTVVDSQNSPLPGVTITVVEIFKDDSASMSAWYVFHTLGFYPVAGTDLYLISSPKNQKSEIIISDNKKIIINAEGVNDKNIYIQSCNLNGKPYNRSWFRHSDIIDGAVIDFIMGDKPSKWSMDGELPPSLSYQY